MLKKLFALASFTAVTGVVVAVSATGCTTTTTTAGESADSGSTTPTKPKDASTDRSNAPPEEEDAGPGTCPTTEPIPAADLPWKPPAIKPANTCTKAQVDGFQQFLKDNPSTTNAQFEAEIKRVSQTCHDCIFTDVANAAWGPIPTQGGQIVTLNIGACFAVVSGKEACGKAIQNEFDCEFVACADCADDTSFNNCRKKAQTGVCKSFVQAIGTGCNGVPQTVDDVCGSFFDSVTVQCVTGGKVDGGDGG